MSDKNQMSYDEIRKEIAEEYRAQIEEEVRLRKEIQEKYYGVYDELQLTKKNLEISRGIQRDLAEYNRELIGCKIPFLKFLNRRRLYYKNEKMLFDKGFSYWAPVFNAAYYAEHNKDVVVDVGTDEAALLKHFVSIGTYQSRQACEEFNVESYMEINPDVADICRTDRRAAYIHYIDHGIREKRRK